MWAKIILLQIEITLYPSHIDRHSLIKIIFYYKNLRFRKLYAMKSADTVFFLKWHQFKQIFIEWGSYSAVTSNNFHVCITIISH